ncbi:hypothetical protein [Neobacillus terrae]|uniref:hypothetical protein n=1 Tax=Neobacillus terrae TaxID=3034837 RepID=UPI00140797E5|nr:hypothetical protein [Neobacillus terrae]NHM30011.1 hypothetical protein [Neobacillus terrae]
MKNGVIIVINYANEEEVINYAEMLGKQNASENLNLVIVNNKSSEKAKVKLKDEIKKIDLPIYYFEPTHNLGYLNGALFGYREFIKTSGKMPDWIVISNTDIMISDARFFEKLLSNEYAEDIWCIAPSVFSPMTNSYQNPQYLSRHSLKKIDRLIFIHRFQISAYIYSLLATIKGKIKAQEKKDSQYVYSAHGCFFALKRSFIEQLKSKDYKGFLYSEEAFIAEHLLIYGKKCFYDNTLELDHKEHSVTAFLGIKNKSKYIRESLKYIRDEFYISK